MGGYQGEGVIFSLITLLGLVSSVCGTNYTLLLSVPGLDVPATSKATRELIQELNLVTTYAQAPETLESPKSDPPGSRGLDLRHGTAICLTQHPLVPRASQTPLTMMMNYADQYPPGKTLSTFCRELGADPTLPNSNGDTILHYALADMPNLLSELVGSGCDLNGLDACGLPPWCAKHRPVARAGARLHRRLAECAWERGSEVDFVRELCHCPRFSPPEEGSSEALWLEEHGRVTYRRRGGQCGACTALRLLGNVVTMPESCPPAHARRRRTWRGAGNP